MRLTAETINNALVYKNPVQERELQLRGHKISSIENLGAADAPECIDFTDNDIAHLGGFPLFPQLKNLMAARNRISTIQSDLAKNVPNLFNLVLTENNVTELADLDPLQGFTRLQHLALMDNPVTSKENFRHYIIHLNPNVRFLNLAKVKDVERSAAKEIFGTVDEPTELALSIKAKKTAQFAPSMKASVNGAAKRSKIELTAKEKARYKELIQKADSVEVMAKLQKDFEEGKIPEGVIQESDAMDET